MFLTDTLAKISQNIVAYSFCSEHFKYFFFVFEEKKKLCGGGGGGQPPPLQRDASAKNASFLTCFLSSSKKQCFKKLQAIPSIQWNQ